MKNDISYFRNRANQQEVEDHLLVCDASFVPPLRGRVDIKSYALKLMEKSERFEAWSERTLIGLVAAYSNDPQRQCAYITIVSVLMEFHGSGVASRLISECITFVKDLGFERIELEVDCKNERALALYKKWKF